MASIEDKFAKLGVDNAPGQEVRQKGTAVQLVGEPLEGIRVDFSHGDVNAPLHHWRDQLQYRACQLFP